MKRKVKIVTNENIKKEEKRHSIQKKEKIKLYKNTYKII